MIGSKKSSDARELSCRALLRIIFESKAISANESREVDRVFNDSAFLALPCASVLPGVVSFTLRRKYRCKVGKGQGLVESQAYAAKRCFFASDTVEGVNDFWHVNFWWIGDEPL